MKNTKYNYFIDHELGEYSTRAIARKVKKFHEEITGNLCYVDGRGDVYCPGNECWIRVWSVFQTIVPLKGK
jgi:hypothetical protein